VTFDPGQMNPELRFVGKFIDGHVSPFPPLYWRPSDQQWVDLPTPPWNRTTLPVPPVPLVFGPQDVNPALVFPDVTNEAKYLTPIYHDTLYWDPRSGDWVTAVSAGQTKSLPPCVPDMKAKLVALEQLHKDGTLDDENWRRQKQRVIEDCLGSTSD
jgi:hypothetical protein